MRNVVKCLAAVIAMSGLHDGARAAEKSYSVSGCQVANQSQQYTLLGGTIAATSAGTIDVYCPIDRRLTSASISWTRVHIFNQNSGLDFACRVVSTDHWGGSLSWKSASTTQMGFRVLNIPNPDQFADWGTFHVYCAVTPNSAMGGYAVSAT